MKTVTGFQHLPGVHCGSTAMRDLLHVAGLDYSEAMCFGLGSGLGFFYYRSPHGGGATPSHLFYGRTFSLERDLCRHLGLDFEEGTGEEAEHAWETAKAWIDRGVPVLLHVELSQLPYYHTRTPFPGHRVVLVGYDDERRIVQLADTNFPGLQEIAYEVLRTARSAHIPPIPLDHDWLAIQPARHPRPLGEAIRLALRDNALGMNLDRAPHQAVMGIETLFEDFEQWGSAPDWQVCARFGYQNIEVRGTGGGFFRKLYAQFLRQAEQLDGDLRAAHLAETMEEIAGEWTALGGILQRVAKEKDPALFKDASRATRRLAMREENFWGRVLNLEIGN